MSDRGTITIETLGIDIAKTVFQLHGVNRNGRLILKRRVMRDQPQHVDDLLRLVTLPCHRWSSSFQNLKMDQFNGGGSLCSGRTD